MKQKNMLSKNRPNYFGNRIGQNQSYIQIYIKSIPGGEYIWRHDNS